MLRQSRNSGRALTASRRAFVFGLAASCAIPDVAWSAEILVVSRERVLREASIARTLKDAEEAMTRQLQTSVDDATARLAAEEEELAKLRAELDAEAFEQRAKDFDRRIRAVRRAAQERAAFLQRGFQEARASVVAALPSLLEQVRVARGASLVLNADQILAADAGVDVTEELIALMDAEGPRPLPPKIDLSLPLLPPPDASADSAATSAQ
ncbi:MAG: OmpH family outer membrane protein [Pseudomonadota bacterium]